MFILMRLFVPSTQAPCRNPQPSFREINTKYVGTLGVFAEMEVDFHIPSKQLFLHVFKRKIQNLLESFYFDVGFTQQGQRSYYST